MIACPPGSIQGSILGCHAQDSDSTQSHLTLTTRTHLKEWSWHSRKEYHHITLDHKHSTSIEEQAVAAALNALSQIGSHKTEYIISSDSLACLMEAEVSSVLVLHVFHQNDCHRPQRPTWVVRMVVDPVSSPNATCPPALVTLNMCINLSFHYATCASI